MTFKNYKRSKKKTDLIKVKYIEKNKLKMNDRNIVTLLGIPSVLETQPMRSLETEQTYVITNRLLFCESCFSSKAAFITIVV